MLAIMLWHSVALTHWCCFNRRFGACIRYCRMSRRLCSADDICSSRHIIGQQNRPLLLLTRCVSCGLLQLTTCNSGGLMQ